MFSLSAEPIENWRGLVDPAAGAAVTFDGHVRSCNEGKAVRALSYEPFDQLAVAEGKRVLAEAGERFDVISAECMHRTGNLQIGELAVRVVVQAAHRKAAFEACEWIIDEVKQRVPIWKKEFYTDGESEWINSAPGMRVQERT